MDKAKEIIEKLQHHLAPLPEIIGITASEPIDEDEIYNRIKAESRRTRETAARKQSQSIIFDHGPVCIICMGDLHLGSAGVDYDLLDKHLDLIVNTPGVYVIQVGDMLDNFIIGRLQMLQKHSNFKVDEEWVLVKRVLEILSPKLIASVSGNHDLWTYKLSGIDYLEEIHRQLTNKAILYDQHEILVDIHVGRAVRRWKIRHKWKGNSQWNDLHAIIKAGQFKNFDGFHIGVGGHTHASGLVGDFNNGMEEGYGVLVGSYKVHDDFPREIGFPKPNTKRSRAIILEEDGTIIPPSSLEWAAWYMKNFYKEAENA